MSTLREVLAGTSDKRHGPLSRLLLILTFVTGLVDAFSYLALGHVFVANMTGNVLFLGFALAGAKGFSIPASLAAIGSFIVGAIVGGKLSSLLARHRGRLLTAATTFQSIFFAIAIVLSFSLSGGISVGHRYPLICCLGVAMGLQNAVIRKMRVPELTTTVLTLTITGIASDHRSLGGPGWKIGPRFSSVAFMFLGAVVGALFVIHVSLIDPLVIVLGLTILVAVITEVLGRGENSWAQPPGA